MELTEEFEHKRATIRFPDGRNVYLWFVTMWNEAGTLRFFDVDEDSFSVYVNSFRNTINLEYNEETRLRTEYSVHNFEKLQIDWVDEKVAVCEIDEDAFTEEGSTWFGIRTGERYAKPDDFEMPSVELWDAAEWEARSDGDD